MRSAETGCTQQRLRKLPSPVVVSLLLAAGLFEHPGYPGIWRTLVAGLDALALPPVSPAALPQARRRVGVRPIRALFDLLPGPASTALTTGTRWCGLLVCAIDGTTMDAPDSAANLRWANTAVDTVGPGIRSCAGWPWWRAAPGR